MTRTTRAASRLLFVLIGASWLVIGCSRDALIVTTPPCQTSAECDSADHSITTCCNGRCVDVAANSMNCGMCSRTCSKTANAASVLCLSGACSVETCITGFADCNGRFEDGCEVDTSNDLASCGGCRNLCATFPNSAPSCALGKCQIARCNAPFGDCDGVPTDGCEIDLSNDLHNCGQCGHSCSFPNAMAQCVTGVCRLLQCQDGYGDCDLNLANGCEDAIGMDPMNCGRCGNACAEKQVCLHGTCRALAGQFNCHDGIWYGSDPATYTCQEACALLFGGQFSVYSCSTIKGAINQMANTAIWGIMGCQQAADNLKKNSLYNCGAKNCSQSAYVADDCVGINYCYK